jgi:hypothetical protein
MAGPSALDSPLAAATTPPASVTTPVVSAQVHTGPDPVPRADSGRVVTPLLADRIEEVLVKLGLHDRWAHVIAGIRYGFNMGIRAQPKRSVIHPNHSSVEAAPSFIDEYIAGECAGQRYLGPFSPTELEALVGPFIVSPLGLVPKQGSSSKWRLIQDLSFPRSVRRIVSSRR